MAYANRILESFGRATSIATFIYVIINPWTFIYKQLVVCFLVLDVIFFFGYAKGDLLKQFIFVLPNMVLLDVLQYCSLAFCH